MIILGVDPGSLVTGYGVVKYINMKIEPVTWGTISCKPISSFQLRLKKIYNAILEIIQTYQPAEMAIESLFHAKNTQSALKLGHARGVILLAAANSDLPVAEYSPRNIKQAITGNGAASKQQVQQMVMRLLGLTQELTSYDVSDSLATAICHCHRIEKNR